MPHAPVGGAVNSFSLLVTFLEEQGLELVVVNSNRFRNRLLVFLYVIFKTLTNLTGTTKVMLNVSGNGFRYLSPICFLLSSLFRKKYIFRIFGGQFDLQYSQLSGIEKWIHTRTTFKSNLLFLQTKQLINYFQNKSKNIAWLPTARNKVAEVAKSEYRRKLIFLGQLFKEKGSEEVSWLAERLDPAYTVHVYGPLKDATSKFLFEGKSYYQGVLKPDEVSERMSDYDVLLLPTYYPGEGYPGVIIEAFSQGLPCIASDWRAIPELITPAVNGYLVPPKDRQALLSAVEMIDETNYPTLSSGAFSSFQTYDSARVLGKALAAIKAC
ncbi:MAG: glycosyltransferase [Bacteroidota bacterium]